MTLKWKLLFVLNCELIIMTYQSITGVTYMSHFDFEERYRDVNECNPLYWHPLHLPEHCADMYEKLIRSNIASEFPVRVVKAINPPESTGAFFSMNVYNMPSFGGYEIGYPDPVYEVAGAPSQEQNVWPYDRMMQLITKDIRRDPSIPVVQVLPGVGPVAVYRQSVSRKTEKLIKKISGKYAKAAQNTNAFAPYQYPFYMNMTKKINKKSEKLIVKHANNGVVTIVKHRYPKDNQKLKN